MQILQLSGILQLSISASVQQWSVCAFAKWTLQLRLCKVNISTTSSTVQTNHLHRSICATALTDHLRNCANWQKNLVKSKFGYRIGFGLTSKLFQQCPMLMRMVPNTHPTHAGCSMCPVWCVRICSMAPCTLMEPAKAFAVPSASWGTWRCD